MPSLVTTVVASLPPNFGVIIIVLENCCHDARVGNLALDVKLSGVGMLYMVTVRRDVRDENATRTIRSSSRGLVGTSAISTSERELLGKCTGSNWEDAPTRSMSPPSLHSEGGF